MCERGSRRFAENQAYLFESKLVLIKVEFHRPRSKVNRWGKPPSEELRVSLVEQYEPRDDEAGEPERSCRHRAHLAGARRERPHLASARRTTGFSAGRVLRVPGQG